MLDKSAGDMSVRSRSTSYFTVVLAQTTVRGSEIEIGSLFLICAMKTHLLAFLIQSSIPAYRIPNFGHIFLPDCVPGYSELVPCYLRLGRLLLAYFLVA